MLYIGQNTRFNFFFFFVHIGYSNIQVIEDTLLEFAQYFRLRGWMKLSHKLMLQKWKKSNHTFKFYSPSFLINWKEKKWHWFLCQHFKYILKCNLPFSFLMKISWQDLKLFLQRSTMYLSLNMTSKENIMRRQFLFLHHPVKYLLHLNTFPGTTYQVNRLLYKCLKESME